MGWLLVPYKTKNRVWVRVGMLAGMMDIFLLMMDILRMNILKMLGLHE